jgi:polysaccharide export outer membrane protein
MKTLVKMFASRIILLALCLPLVSCASTSMQTVSSAPNIPASHKISPDYEIGPDDVLEVLVWRNEALSKTVTVRPDGKISLPLIGDVEVAGQTAEQVREAITTRLTGYYKDLPQVSIIVQEVNSYVIYIMGEIQRPAQYVVKRGTTFLQAVALAGGFTPFASTNDIYILRNGQGNNGQTALRIRYKDIFTGKHQENNILLKAGDTIIVP